MLFQTRLSRYLTDIFYYIKTKFFNVQGAFSLILLSLFIGFIFGNLFGTFLDTLRVYFFWNGLIGLMLLLFIEIVNFLVYGVSFSKTDKQEPAVDDSNQNSFNNFSVIKIQTNLISSTNFGTSKKVDNDTVKSRVFTKLNNAVITKETNNSFFMVPLKDKWFYLINNLWKPKITCLQKITFFSKNIVHLKIERVINSFKIGLLFGFFVDSFKVGS